MAVKRVCLLLLAGIWPVGTIAQFSNKPLRVELMVTVYVDSLSNPAPQQIVVQLLDNFGSIEGELRTDPSGKVDFHTTDGHHGLRIYGPQIQEYTQTLEIDGGGRKIENIVVKSKDGAESENSSTSASGMVAAARLKIPAKAQQEFKQGADALQQKNWADARKRFEAAIALYPDYDVAYNGLGDAFLGAGDMQAARPAFEKAISLNDAFAEAYRNLARISLSEKKYAEADTLLVKSLSSDPLNARALTYAANAELLTHKYNEAIEHARKAHTVPHDGLAGVHIVAALALEATQKQAEAVEEYRLYLQEDPSGRDASRAQKAIARLGSPAAK